MTLSEPYYSVKSNLIFCLSIPIYVMLFMVLYSPTFGINGHDGWLSDWNQHAGLCLPIICAILNLLVRKGILDDERLVRAADRIR